MKRLWVKAKNKFQSGMETAMALPVFPVAQKFRKIGQADQNNAKTHQIKGACLRIKHTPKDHGKNSPQNKSYKKNRKMIHFMEILFVKK
jgi:hypothetical protein